jgi:hypothetical protein
MLGVRYIDLRITVTYDAFDRPDSIYVSHTFKSNLTFVESLTQVRDFLTMNPTEVVFVMLRVDAQNPINVAADAKKLYIESVMVESGLQFAQFNSIANLKVKDVAGKAIIVTPKGKFLPNNTTYSYIDTNTSYAICDIWQYSSINAARARIAECFPQVPVDTTISGVLTGYALDGFLNQLPQNVTSPQMNDWWFLNFQHNPDWILRKKYPIGVFMIDFANYTYMSALLDFTMNFAYPYPYNGPEPLPWEPGANITQYKSSRISESSLITFVVMLALLIAN